MESGACFFEFVESFNDDFKHSELTIRTIITYYMTEFPVFGINVSFKQILVFFPSFLIVKHFKPEKQSLLSSQGY